MSKLASYCQRNVFYKEGLNIFKTLKTFFKIYKHWFSVVNRVSYNKIVEIFPNKVKKMVISRIFSN